MQFLCCSITVCLQCLGCLVALQISWHVCEGIFFPVYGLYLFIYLFWTFPKLSFGLGGVQGIAFLAFMFNVVFSLFFPLVFSFSWKIFAFRFMCSYWLFFFNFSFNWTYWIVYWIVFSLACCLQITCVVCWHFTSQLLLFAYRTSFF